MGNYWDVPGKSCTQALCPKTLKLHPCGSVAVRVFVNFVEIRQKFIYLLSTAAGSAEILPLKKLAKLALLTNYRISVYFSLKLHIVALSVDLASLKHSVPL